MKLFKTISAVVLLLIILTLVLLFSGVIWRSPKYYMSGKSYSFEEPIMDMQTYESNATHPRPYIYQVTTSSKGAVYVLGIEHTRNNQDPQIDSIKRIWKLFKPDFALVEGRMGFLFSWFQNPVKVYGESGATVQLSKSHSVSYYTWEPDRQAEINIMLKKYTAEKLAMFYCLRPYLSSFRFGKPKNPDETMEGYIKSRTDFNGIKGIITSVSQLDSMWKKEFPQLKNWREMSDINGWPDGWLSDVANLSNLTRDIHMCNVICELVAKGNKIFVTMGSSHAFRIERTLRAELKKM